MPLPPSAPSYAVAAAIREGRLQRPTHCEACGVPQERRPARGSYRVIYHHPVANYAPGMWLTGLIMLCRSCHARVHRSRMPEPGTGLVWEPPRIPRYTRDAKPIAYRPTPT